MAAPSGRWARWPGRVVSVLRGRPSLLAALAVLATLVLLALFAPWLSTHDPLEIDPLIRLRAPSADHWFGTDTLGRDVFSRTILGGRVSLLVGAGVALLSAALGLVLGLASGYFKTADLVIGRVMDGLMAIPAILMAISLIALTRPDVATVIVVIAIPEIPRVVRLVRSVVLGLRGEAFVEAAVLSGSSSLAVLLRHIVPNIAAPLLVQLTFIASVAVMIEAALSFLGVGIPPEQASWGGMVADGRGVYARATWVMLFPGLFLAAMVLAIQVLGDSVRDLLDPRMRTAVRGIR